MKEFQVQYSLFLSDSIPFVSFSFIMFLIFVLHRNNKLFYLSSFHLKCYYSGSILLCITALILCCVISFCFISAQICLLATILCHPQLDHSFFFSIRTLVTTSLDFLPLSFCGSLSDSDFFASLPC